MPNDEEVMTVKLTLRRHVAERLRGMCHAQNLTASHLVDRWVFEHFDDGTLNVEAVPKTGLDKIRETLQRLGVFR